MIVSEQGTCHLYSHYLKQWRHVTKYNYLIVTVLVLQNNLQENSLETTDCNLNSAKLAPSWTLLTHGLHMSFS